MSAWEAGLEIYSKINVIIPERILNVCDSISAVPKIGGNEFSIFLKIAKREGANIYLSEEFVIPPQRVTPGSINYGRDPEGAWDVVIHRHPVGMHTFSSTDMEYINQNFKVSILYTPQAKFVKALVNVPFKGLGAVVDPEVESDEEMLQVDAGIFVARQAINVDMIEVESTAVGNYYNKNYGQVNHSGNTYESKKSEWPKDTKTTSTGEWDVDEGDSSSKTTTLTKEEELMTFEELEKKIDSEINPKLDELKNLIKSKSEKEVTTK